MAFHPPVEGRDTVILGTPYPKCFFSNSPMVKALLKAGLGILMVDLWGGGEIDLRQDISYPEKFYNRSLMWMGRNLQGKWVEDFMLAEKWLSRRLKGGRIAAAGFRESTLAAALFGALREQKTDLYLENVPGEIDAPETSAKYGQSLLVPGLYTCADMERLEKETGGKVKCF